MNQIVAGACRLDLLHIPHLYWHCTTSGQNNEFLVKFDVLIIDHGLSTVLISEEYVLKLGLHRKCLHEPYSAELAMENNGQKVNIEFSEYIKLQLQYMIFFFLVLEIGSCDHS